MIGDSSMLLLIAALVAVVSYYLWISTKRPKYYPPGPPIYPFFGNTKQLRSAARRLGGQHRVFEDWTRDYKSAILGLRLGRENYVVVTSYKFVREIHTREEFDGRPDNFFLRLRTMGHRLGVTCVDGPLWQEQRSFVTRHLREAGYGRQPMDEQIEDELSELIRHLDGLKGEESVWPGEMLPINVMNVLWQFTAGHRMPRNDERMQKVLRLLRERSKGFDMSGGVLSQMPWIRFVAPDWSGFTLIQTFNEKLCEFFMEIIHDHHQNFDSHKAQDDLIYAFINEMKEKGGDANSNFTDLQLTMIILDIFIAGGNTTSTTLDLAFMTLILFPDIKARLFEELSPHANPTSKIRPQLPFCEAYLMEIQRFFHIVPVSGPRRVTKTTTLGDYVIPKNTTVLIGLRTVHMDKEFWGDPEVFRPERFLESPELTDHLMPFGQGKRRCLGEALARSCLFTFFVGVLRRFDVQQPANAIKPDLNLLPGITLSAKPYQVLFKRRRGPDQAKE